MASLRSVGQLKNLRGKKVLVRVDFNVPLKNGKILETERVDRTLRTITWLQKKGAAVILVSHLGRPDGKKNLKYSLKPVANYLNKKISNLFFCTDPIGPVIDDCAASLEPGQVLLLENIRFYKGEEINDKKFARSLAALADIFVNDAFAVSHRKHASVYAVAKLLPSYAGFNMLDEVKYIEKVLKKFWHPGLAIIGGVKISGKIKVIEKFLSRFEHVLIGGALANNFLAAQGHPLGKSFFEKDFVKVAAKLMKKFGGRIVLPVDLVISQSLEKAIGVKTVMVDELATLKPDFYTVDIGPKSVRHFDEYINKANTLIWNGPLGLFEKKPFDKGTNAVARAFASRAKKPPFGLIGGGETIAAVNRLNLENKIDFISTGGGAMLEYIELGTLPGIEVLKAKITN